MEGSTTSQSAPNQNGRTASPSSGSNARRPLFIHSSATFDLTLPTGPATLQTWLTRQDGTTHGAYFVTVRWHGQ